MALSINPYATTAKAIVERANAALTSGAWEFQFELPCRYSFSQVYELFAEVNRTPNMRRISYEIADRECRGCSEDWGCKCKFEDTKLVKVVIH